MSHQTETAKALAVILQDEGLVEALLQAPDLDMVRRFIESEVANRGYVTPVEELIHSLVLLRDQPRGPMDAHHVAQEYEEFQENWRTVEADIVTVAHSHRDLILKTLGLAPPAEAESGKVGE